MLILETKTSGAQSHISNGIAFLNKGRASEAIDEFCKAVRADPGCADAYLHSGDALSLRGEEERRSGNSDAAVKYFSLAAASYLKTIKLSSESPEITSYAYAGMGAAYKRMGNMQVYKECLEKAKEISREGVISFYKAEGDRLLEDKQVTEAASDYLDAIYSCRSIESQINQNILAELYKQLGLAQLMNGDYPNAKNNFDTAQRLNPDPEIAMKLNSLADNAQKEVAFLERAYKTYCSSKGNKLLDVGCGYGLLEIPLSRSFTVTALDKNQDCQTIGNLSPGKIKFVRQEFGNDTKLGPFDVVACIDVIHSIDVSDTRMYEISDEAFEEIIYGPDVGGAIKNFSRVTKPGGIAVFDICSIQAEGSQGYGSLTLDPDALEKTADDAGLKVMARCEDWDMRHKRHGSIFVCKRQ